MIPGSGRKIAFRTEELLDELSGQPGCDCGKNESDDSLSEIARHRRSPFLSFDRESPPADRVGSDSTIEVAGYFLPPKPSIPSGKRTTTMTSVTSASVSCPTNTRDDPGTSSSMAANGCVARNICLPTQYRSEISSALSNDRLTNNAPATAYPFINRIGNRCDR